MKTSDIAQVMYQVCCAYRVASGSPIVSQPDWRDLSDDERAECERAATMFMGNPLPLAGAWRPWTAETSLKDKTADLLAATVCRQLKPFMEA